MTTLNRRAILKTGAATAALSVLPRIGFAQEGETETHGLSSDFDTIARQEISPGSTRRARPV